MYLNWRQIFIHFLASFCLMLAFRTLACLTNIELLEAIVYRKSDPTIEEQGTLITNLVSFAATISLTGTLGLLISLIISLSISLNKKWGWSNSVLVFVVIYSIGWMSIRGESITGILFKIFGNLLADLKIEISVIGVLLITFSLLLFFSKGTNKFIATNSAK